MFSHTADINIRKMQTILQNAINYLQIGCTLIIQYLPPHFQTSLSVRSILDETEKSIFLQNNFCFSCVYAFFVVPLQSHSVKGSRWDSCTDPLL